MFSSEGMILHIMQIVSWGTNLHGVSFPGGVCLCVCCVYFGMGWGGGVVIANLSSAELSQKVVKVNRCFYFAYCKSWIYVSGICILSQIRSVLSKKN